MPRLNPTPEDSELDFGRAQLKNCEYPGRVLIMGLSALGDAAVQGYALTGRSPSSRNRVFVPTDNYGRDIKVAAPNMSEQEMSEVENAELIYYTAMSDRDGIYVASNGAQTAPVLERIDDGCGLARAVRLTPTISGVDLSKYEPDAPNFTPRITGAINIKPSLRDGAAIDFGISIVRKSKVSEVAKHSTYTADLRDFIPGAGYGIQTYAENGDPLPSFEQAPYAFRLGETAAETASSIWQVLNRDTRVAVVVRHIELKYEGLEYSTVHEA
ncbi:hypothetical protein HY380_01700 [Candidatus Saccharibacteria bacterium]|nr:hypothetical protein [Candidatus Saccharibacteria bacterium]